MMGHGGINHGKALWALPMESELSWESRGLTGPLTPHTNRLGPSLTDPTAPQHAAEDRKPRVSSEYSTLGVSYAPFPTPLPAPESLHSSHVRAGGSAAGQDPADGF